MKRVKSVVLLVAIQLIFIVILLLSVLFQESDAINRFRLVVHLNNSDEIISLYKDGDIYYAFLPSYAENDITYFSTDSGNTVYVDGKKYVEEDNLDGISFNYVHNLIIKNAFGFSVCKEKIILMKSANISTLSISLNDTIIEKIENDKTVKKSGTISVINGKGEINYSGALKAIHSRGNASWNSPKKPYTLEFENEVNLLNMGAGKKWVLLANAYDATNMKNKIVLEAAQELGVRFCSSSEFVDLYINGEYRGLYLLAEKIEIGENRVDINNLEEKTQIINFKSITSYSEIQEKTGEGASQIRYYDIPDNPNDISGGYILKNEMVGRIPEDSFFVTSSGSTFDCESPKYATEEQIKYISLYFQNIEDSLKDYKKISELIDIDSFVKRYLLQECFANVEGSSYYYIKDIGEKVYAEPIWDFDNSLGTADTESTTGLYCRGGIFAGLLKSSEFSDKVRDVYIYQMKNIYKRCDTEISSLETTISQSDAMNKIRWRQIFSQDQTLTYSTSLLRNYLRKRESFLDSLWIDNVNYINITFDDPENIIDYFQTYSVEYGGQLDNVIILEKNGYKFLGWFDSETEEEFNLSEPITADHTYYAKWEKLPTQEKNASSIKEYLYLLKKDIKNDLDLYISIAIVSVFAILFCIFMIKDFAKKEKR